MTDKRFMTISFDTIEQIKRVAEKHGNDWKFEQDNCLCESPDFETGGLLMKHEDVGLRIWNIRIGRKFRSFRNWIDRESELIEWLNLIEAEGG